MPYTSPIKSLHFSDFNDKAEDFSLFLEAIQLVLQGNLEGPQDDCISHWYKIEVMLKTTREKIDNLMTLGNNALNEADKAHDYTKAIDFDMNELTHLKVTAGAEKNSF